MSYSISGMTRITGMYSGLDTDKLISDLMKVENQKVDKVRQDKQYLEWKQEAYREIIGALRDFEDKYFSYGNPSTNLRSSSTFNGYAVNMGSEDDNRYIEIASTAGALSGNYTISNISLAKSARVEGSAISTGSIESEDITFPLNIDNAGDNNKITVTLNGASKEITIGDGINSIANISDLVTDLQTKIDEEFGVNQDLSKKITVGNSGNKLTFSTNSTNNLSIGYAYNKGYQLLGTSLGTTIDINSQNNKFELTYDEITPAKLIEIPEKSDYSVDELADEIQKQIDSAFSFNDSNRGIRVVNNNGKLSLKTIDGTKTATVTNGWDTHVVKDTDNKIPDDITGSFTVTLDGQDYNITLEDKTYTKEELVSTIQSKVDSSKVLVTLDDLGKLRFEAISNKELTTDKVENTGLDALKFNNVNVSNKVDLSSKLADAKFSTPLTTDAGGIIEFTINGERFEFDCDGDADTDGHSLGYIISTVNNNQNANVRMMYDELRDKIVVESKDTGATAKVEISDVAGNFMQVLGLKDAKSNGSDASVTIDDGNGVQTISRPSNEFSVNGISYDLKEDYAGNVSFKVEGDSDELFDKINGFVEDYNKIIEDINKKLKEEKDYDYKPLTEAQKDGMKEKEIEIWEEKAKSGILRSDSTLRSLVNNMREIMYESVDGMALFSVGITTTANYKEAGKLIIDEDKLREAIEDNPDQIANLFSKEDEGIASKLYNVLEENVSIRTNSNGQKGLLLEKAGMTGDRTVNNNILSNQIFRYDDMITDMLDDLVSKENYYYNMFAKMESALSKMQSQSSFFMGQMG